MLGREQLTKSEEFMLYYSNVCSVYDETVKYHELVEYTKKADFNKLSLEDKKPSSHFKIIIKIGIFT